MNAKELEEIRLAVFVPLKEVLETVIEIISGPVGVPKTELVPDKPFLILDDFSYETRPGVQAAIMSILMNRKTCTDGRNIYPPKYSYTDNAGNKHPIDPVVFEKVVVPEIEYEPEVEVSLGYEAMNNRQSCDEWRYEHEWRHFLEQKERRQRENDRYSPEAVLIKIWCPRKYKELHSEIRKLITANTLPFGDDRRILPLHDLRTGEKYGHFKKFENRFKEILDKHRDENGDYVDCNYDIHPFLKPIPA